MFANEKFDLLQRNPLFKSLLSNRRKAIAPQRIVQADFDPCGDCFLVESGLLKLFKYDEYGGEVVLLILGPGDLIIHSLNGFQGLAGMNIASLTDVTLICIKNTTLEQLLTGNSDFLIHLLKSYGAFFRFVSDRFVKDQSDAKNKILSMLVCVASKWSEDGLNVDFIKSLGHQQCSLIANVARETFSRMITKLKQDKFILTEADGSMHLNPKVLVYLGRVYSEPA